MKNPIEISKKAPTAVTETPESLRAGAAARSQNASIVARKIETAEAELQAARAAYDSSLEVFAAEEDGREPDRAPIASAEAKLEGLRRLEAGNKAEIVRLLDRANVVELEGLKPGELTFIAEARAKAERLLIDYSKAITAAKSAEAAFYASIATLRTREFRASTSEARTAYGHLFGEALDTAIEAEYQPGIANINHGMPVLYAPEQFSIRILRGERLAARSRALAS